MRLRSTSLLTFAVAAAVAASAVFWGLRLTLRAAAAPAHTVVVSATNPTAGDWGRVLGNDAPALAPVAEEGPADRRFQLIGVVAPRGQGSAVAAQGLALIAVDGKPARAYRVGMTVDGEQVLQAVTARSARIGPRGGAAAGVDHGGAAAGVDHGSVATGAERSSGAAGANHGSGAAGANHGSGAAGAHRDSTPALTLTLLPPAAAAVGTLPPSPAMPLPMAGVQPYAPAAAANPALAPRWAQPIVPQTAPPYTPPPAAPAALRRNGGAEAQPAENPVPANGLNEAPAQR